MKRAIILLVTIAFIPFLGFAQTTESFDYISPFNDGLAAVKKDNQWAFINGKGDIVIDFRNDLVTTKTTDGEYPVFKSDRCIIIKKENEISYFGYINTSGKTVIKPVFLNATNFLNNVAIVLKLNKEKAGYNNVLGKNVIYYNYLEVIINANGEIKDILTKPTNVVLRKEKLKIPPKITSKFLSSKLVSVKNKKGSWTLKKIQK